MEEVLKEKLHLGFVKCSGHCCGTNESEILETDEGRLFVKFGTEELVNGELESLKAIQNTNAISCPKPICTIDLGDKSALVTSHIDMKRSKESSTKFAKQLAEMHAHNAKLLEEQSRMETFVGGEGLDSSELIGATENFGFHVPTCCGWIPQENNWVNNWETFFIRHRLEPQIRRLIEQHQDKFLIENSELLYRAASSLLQCRNGIAPALVHGDLWGGNWSGCLDENGQEGPVVFDPSASFSDPEFEQGIMQVFGGVTNEFCKNYYQIMKDQDGRDSRVKLYELYHLLNHWNHFGGSYKNSAIRLIQEIITK